MTVQKHTHMHGRTHAGTHGHFHTKAHTYVDGCTYACTQVHERRKAHTLAELYISVLGRGNIKTDIHAHTCMVKHTHTHMLGQGKSHIHLHGPVIVQRHTLTCETVLINTHID